jgi:hypothetical protein
MKLASPQGVPVFLRRVQRFNVHGSEVKITENKCQKSDYIRQKKATGSQEQETSDLWLNMKP